MTLQNLKDYNETQYGESRIELLHKFQPFVDALKNQKPGKNSSWFICPIYLLEASPTNRKIYKDFELYLKDPNADTKLVRKMNYLIHGESGLLNYSYSDPDGVGNQEPICIDENGYIRHGDRRVFGSGYVNLENVRVYICQKEKAYDPNRTVREDMKILLDYNLGKLAGRDEDDWVTAGPAWKIIRDEIAEEEGYTDEQKFNSRNFSEERKKFGRERGLDNSQLIAATKMLDEFDEDEAMRFFEMIDNNESWHDGHKSIAVNKPTKAYDILREKNTEVLLNEPQFFYKYFQKYPSMAREFQEELTKDVEKLLTLYEFEVNGEIHNKITSPIYGWEEGPKSFFFSQTAMSNMAAVMARYGFTTKVSSRENDTVYDIEITHYKGKELKGKDQGYFRPTIEVKVAVFKDTQGATNKWGGGAGAGTKKCPSVTDYLLLCRSEDCRSWWGVITTINQEDWKRNGTKGRGKTEGSKIISAKSWAEGHYEKGDYTQLFGDTEIDGSKVNLILEEL